MCLGLGRRRSASERMSQDRAALTMTTPPPRIGSGGAEHPRDYWAGSVKEKTIPRLTAPNPTSAVMTPTVRRMESEPETSLMT